MSGPLADRNLLFGILALQMDFIGRDALIAAMHAWVLKKQQPLSQVLFDQGALTADLRAVLDALVEKHLDVHRGDPQQSLAAIRLPAEVRRDLETFADPDVQASLVAVRPGSSLAEQTTLQPKHERADNGDRYEILRPHAFGGLGEVFVAEDRELHREVALKRLHDRHAGSADSRLRFMQEAEITGGLEHPGIVPVHGMGMSADGRPFYAMRFIRGETLKAAIERFHNNAGRSAGQQRIELRQLLTRFIAVCNAIEYAHSRGVIHRDLKPNNIMLGKHGETLVVDWGLAKALGKRSEGAPPEEQTLVPSSGTSSSETLPGSAIGTPAYMSPEQSEGRLDDIGPASDIYSLGATLYSILTGKEPFESTIVGVILGKVQRGDFKPPRQVSSAVPAALEAICLKAMRLAPQDRYPTCAALASDVEHWMADEPIDALRDPVSVRAARWIRRHRVMAARIAGLAAGLFVGLITTVWLLSRANTQIAEHAGETEKQRQFADVQRDFATEQKSVAEQQRKIAEEQQKLADVQRKLAEERELTARRYLYAANMNLAQQAWERGHVRRVMELLDGERPQKGQQDLRSFGWYYLWRLCHSELLTLPGDGRTMGSVAFSPDRKTIATATFQIVLWDAKTGKPRRFLGHHGGPDINDLEFSPDGRTLISSGDDSEVRLWDVTSGQQIAVLSGHTGKVVSIALSRDGKLLASGSTDGTVRIWNVPQNLSPTSFIRPFGDALKVLGLAPKAPAATTSLLRTTLKEHLGPVYGVAISPDGTRLASAGQDRRVRVWTFPEGKLQATLAGHTDAVTPIAFSPDGTLLVSGSDDTTVKVWDVANAKEIETLSAGSDWVQSLAFSTDGRLLAVGSRDTTVRVWRSAAPIKPVRGVSAESGASGGKSADQPSITPWTTFKGHIRGVNCVTFTADGKQLASASEDGTARLWDVVMGQEHVTLRGHSGRLYALAVSPDGSVLASGGDDSQALLWDMRTREHRATLASHVKRVLSVAFSPDGNSLVSGGSMVWQSMGGALPDAATGSTNPLAYRTGNNSIQVWDVATASMRSNMGETQGAIMAVAWSPDGKTLAYAGFDRMARLWDVPSGRDRAQLRGHGGEVRRIAFSRDGKTVATCGLDGTVRIWDVGTGRHQSTIVVSFTGGAQSVAFSPDGTTLATGSNDHLVRLWNTADGSPRNTLRGHTATVNSVAFSPNGQHVASASSDATVMLWDVATGRELVTLKGHATVVQGLAFSPDGQVLASVSFDQTVKLWNVGAAAESEVLAHDLRTQPARAALTNYREAQQHNNDAWRLATDANPQARNVPRAVELAKKAVELVPTEGMFWNTLGIAQYRAGDGKASREALDKSMEIAAGGAAPDWFFVAMNLQRAGDTHRARLWYDRALTWMHRTRENDAELLRFRVEAAALLGLPENASLPAGDFIALEGEDLLGKASADNGPFFVQGMQNFGYAWSGGGQLLWHPQRADARLTVRIAVPRAGDYALAGYFTKSYDFGSFEVSVNGKATGVRFDGFSPLRVICAPPVDFGRVSLREGLNSIEFRVLRPDLEPANRFALGIDGLTLRRVD